MPTLTVSEAQVVDLIKQLPGESQFNVFMLLASTAHAQREARMQAAEASMRRLCEARGQHWDALSEDEREQLIVELVHEDRPCAR